MTNVTLSVEYFVEYIIFKIYFHHTKYQLIIKII